MAYSTKTKIRTAFLIFLIIIGLSLWTMDINIFSDLYRNSKIKIEEDYKFESSLPFPMIVLCPKSVLNTSSPMLKGSNVDYFSNRDALHYISAALNPSIAISTMNASGIQESWNVLFTLMQQYEFNKKFVENNMLISCRALIRNCNIGRTQLTSQQCCQFSSYRATPKGLCLAFSFKDYRQNTPGIDGGIKMAFRSNEDKKSTISAVENQVFPVDLYLHGSDGVRSENMKNYMRLENEVSTKISIDMVKIFRSSLGKDCSGSVNLLETFQTNTEQGQKRAALIESERSDFEKCLINEIRTKCDCDPLISLWFYSNPPSKFKLCSFEKSLSCAKHILAQWSFAPKFEEEMHRFSPCKRELHCESIEFEKTVDTVSSLYRSQTDVNIYYDRLVVKIVERKWSMSAMDLTVWIIVTGCCWFVMCFVVFQLLKLAINLCFSGKPDSKVDTNSVI